MDPRTEPQWTEHLLAHAGWVRRLAGRLVADSSVADDLVQETWLAALTHRPSAARPLRPWLARVLRAQLALRRRGRIHRRDREAAAARPEPLPSAEELAIRTEAHVGLVRAVRALREPFRSAIVLHFYEGLSAAEIARRRGVPDATVRSQIHRGLECLRADLDAEFGDRRSWCLALAPLDSMRPAPGAPIASKLPLAAKLCLAGMVAGGLGWLASAPLRERAAHAAGAPPRIAGGFGSSPGGPTALAQVETGRSPEPLPESAGGRRVRLVDGETGEPLPDFQVLARGPAGQVRHARTDGAGTFRLELSGAAGAWEFALIDEARLRQRDAQVHGAPIDVHVPSERRELAADAAEIVVAAPAGPTYALDLDLPPQLALSGLRAHLRAAGVPAFDTRKWAMHFAPVRPPGWIDAPWVRFAAIEAGFLGKGPPWALELTSADGFWAGSTEVGSIAGRHPGRLSVALRPRAKLRGRVLDRVGPVTRGALLHLLASDGSPTYHRVDTDGEGAFALSALEPGAYRLAVESTRHAPAEVELSLEGGIEAVVQIELARAPVAGTVEGVLTSRTGRYGGQVIILLASTDIASRRFFDGADWSRRGDSLVAPFAFEDVPRGRYVLQVLACDDRLPWQPRQIELEAPGSGLRLECQDDVETDSLVLHASGAPEDAPLSSFSLVYSIDGGPEVVLEHVRPAPSAHPAEPLFEWRVRLAGVTWALRSGPAQIPRAPRGCALRWGVFADGHAPRFGDETAFAELSGLRTARVTLDRGWGYRLRVVEDDAARQPLGGVELWADGRAVAVSRPDGVLECRLDTAPRALELRHSDGSSRSIDPALGLPTLLREVRLRR